MTWLRLLNPIRHYQLEREITANREQVERLKSGTLNFIDMMGRQLPPDSAGAVLRRAIIAENEASVMRLSVASALRELRRGRHDMAAADLEAILGVDHTPAVEPMHLVDVVA